MIESYVQFHSDCKSYFINWVDAVLVSVSCSMIYRWFSESEYFLPTSLEPSLQIRVKQPIY